eukprot:3941959-Rhodomonas_salina.2
MIMSAGQKTSCKMGNRIQQQEETQKMDKTQTGHCGNVNQSMTMRMPVKIPPKSVWLVHKLDQMDTTATEYIVQNVAVSGLPHPLRFVESYMKLHVPNTNAIIAVIVGQMVVCGPCNGKTCKCNNPSLLCECGNNKWHASVVEGLDYLNKYMGVRLFFCNSGCTHDKMNGAMQKHAGPAEQQFPFNVGLANGLFVYQWLHGK